MKLTAARPGVSLQAAVDRAHGHGVFQTTLTGDVVSASSAPLGATAVTGGTAHTKGSWAQVTAATTAPITGFHLVINGNNFTNATDTSTLLDVGIGGAGSEVVIVPNIGYGFRQSAAGGSTVDTFPVYIPQGSRIAVRAQSIRTSQNVPVLLTPFKAPNTLLHPPTALVDVCANTATSYGVALAVPAGANTKGAWTELTASCSQALQAVVITPQLAADAAMAAGTTGLVDIAVGAAGSEVATVSNWPVYFNLNEALFTVSPTLVPLNVPKGARIAARYQATNVGNSLDLQLIGVPA